MPAKQYARRAAENHRGYREHREAPESREN